MFALFRDIYREVEHADGLYDSGRSDVNTVEELEAYHDGRSVQCDLKPLVASRKVEYSHYEQEDLPHHFATKGMVYHHNSYQYDGQLDLNPQPQDGVLQGIGC